MKNNEQFDKFIRDFETIRMTTTEKNKIAQNLEAFAYSHVITPSPYLAYISYFKKSLAIALVAILFVSASKPASAKSLPGELLYPVKIIHERIVSASITEPEKKVVYEIKRTENRIQEAVHLANTNKLDSDTQKKIAVDIQKQVADVSEKIENVKQTNPESALSLNSDLKTTLKVNSEALKTVTRSTKKNENSETTLALAVESKKPVISETALAKEITATAKTIPLTKIEPIAKSDTQEKKSLATVSENSVQTENLKNTDSTNNDDYNSFADIILDTIEGTIEDTQKTEGIISVELVEKLDEKESLPTTRAIPVIKKETVIKTTPVQMQKPVFAKPLTLETVKSVIVTNNVNQQVPASTELQKPEQNMEQIIPLQITEKNNEKALKVSNLEIVSITSERVQTPTTVGISSDVQSQITSLEKILVSEKKLDALVLELAIARDEKNKGEIQRLLDTEKRGQALLLIQQEIEKLSEIKLGKQIKVDLGITVKQPIEKNITKTLPL